MVKAGEIVGSQLDEIFSIVMMKLKLPGTALSPDGVSP